MDELKENEEYERRMCKIVQNSLEPAHTWFGTLKGIDDDDTVRPEDSASKAGRSSTYLPPHLLN